MTKELEKYVFENEKLRYAMSFAKEKHSGQTRDEGTPYFEHLEGTIEILFNEGKIRNEEILIIGILHDVLEDTNCTYQELKKEFGSNIANSVKLLSKEIKSEKINNLNNIKLDFDKYCNQIFTNIDYPNIIIVKLADRLHNLRSILKTNNINKINRKIDETQRYILKYQNSNKINNCLFEDIKKQIIYIKQNTLIE